MLDHVWIPHRNRCAVEQQEQTAGRARTDPKHCVGNRVDGVGRAARPEHLVPHPAHAVAIHDRKREQHDVVKGARCAIDLVDTRGVDMGVDECRGLPREAGALIEALQQHCHTHGTERGAQSAESKDDPPQQPRGRCLHYHEGASARQWHVVDPGAHLQRMPPAPGVVVQKGRQAAEKQRRADRGRRPAGQQSLPPNGLRRQRKDVLATSCVRAEANVGATEDRG
mmetsp:Transcript_48792/g.97340  ORF Transcript_48792/g.97340 Transcript_48792/m.97340 type:complete len:225 (-) Transcript_48792:12-686(-)